MTEWKGDLISFCARHASELSSADNVRVWKSDELSFLKMFQNADGDMNACRVKWNATRVNVLDVGS